MRSTPSIKENWRALEILAGFTAARILLAFNVGLGVDESYTIAISRSVSLSYFDHPPLHLWIARLAVLALGENVAVRIAFIFIFFATGWIYYRFVSRLFGPRSALVALFALNVTPFFFASAGGWVVPDGPLLFGLVVAAWAAAWLFFPDPAKEVSAWRFWPIVGLGLGLAGLSKYSAILTGTGLVTFMLVSPEQRHWFKHRAPYISAILTCAMITPVVLWNAQHGWVSFEFQGNRGVPTGHLHLAQLATMAFGEVAFLSPWIFAPLIAGLFNAVRTCGDERCLFLLCLSLPPILIFTITPLWGGRGQPHWTMPGWFFAFALMGIWVDSIGVSTLALRRWALVSAALLGVVATLAVVQASTGWPWLILVTRSTVADPMLESFEWSALKNAPIFEAGPSFVISTKWSDAGKIAVALGPNIPVIVLSNDPRGWAYLDSCRFVGESGVIITPVGEIASTLAAAGPLFAKLDKPQFYALGRYGRPEIRLALIPATGLTRSLPMPYPSPTCRWR